MTLWQALLTLMRHPMPLPQLNLKRLQLISFFLEYLSQEPYASLDRRLLLVSGAESQLLTFLDGMPTSNRPPAACKQR